MFKRSVLIAAAIVTAFSMPVRAADVLPVKAPAIAAIPNPCSQNGCSGFFVGAEVSGSGSGVNVLNLGELSAGGTYMGMNAGYQMYNGTYWLGAKAKIEYAVAQPSNGIVDQSFNNKFFAFEGAEIGAALGQFFGGVAPISFGGLLSNAVPTFLVGACQNGSKLQGYCTGAAIHYFVPNTRWTVDADYLNAQYGQTTTAPGQTVTTENRGSLGFSYHF